MKIFNKDALHTKAAALEKIKKYGPPTYTEEEIEEMVAKRFERRIKEGCLEGMNLPYMKVELISDIE